MMNLALKSNQLPPSSSLDFSPLIAPPGRVPVAACPYTFVRDYPRSGRSRPNLSLAFFFASCARPFCFCRGDDFCAFSATWTSGATSAETSGATAGATAAETSAENAFENVIDRLAFNYANKINHQLKF